MKKIFPTGLGILLFVLTSNSTLWAQFLPYPQQMNWQGCIKPNNHTTSVLNEQVSSYYDYWRNKYLVPSVYTTNAYFVQGENTGGSTADKGTSEGHGYGMIITALMAGYDANAKTYYDGLYKFYDNHRSSINNNLMGWLIDAQERGSGTYSSATDGDMDIAYSLLLAHYQWGSSGTINYLNEAKRMINAIKASNINSSNRPNLGDWDNNAYHTRPSDWMFDHFQAFYNHTNDQAWINLRNNLYTIMNAIQGNQAAVSGLMPDFVTGSTPAPANPNFLEGPYDGAYYYNACRVPMRTVMDYAHYQNTSAKTAVQKMVTWIKTKTNNVPSAIRAGYYLNGDNLPVGGYQDAVFIAPFVAAAICDAQHQAYLNTGWNLIRNMKSNYFSDTFNLLAMLFITGNWWIPDETLLQLNLSPNAIPHDKSSSEVQQFPNPFQDKITLSCFSTDKPTNVVLTDLSGRALLQKEWDSAASQLEFETSELSEGIYFIRFSTNTQVHTLKVIKQ
jgi:endo-1,4-beta-D-glucanase Y